MQGVGSQIAAKTRISAFESLMEVKDDSNLFFMYWSKSIWENGVECVQIVAY